MRDPSERLHDILEAIENIEKYSSLGRGRFEDDELIQTWIVRNLQIIGEAANRIPDEIKFLHPNPLESNNRNAAYSCP